MHVLCVCVPAEERAIFIHACPVWSSVSTDVYVVIIGVVHLGDNKFGGLTTKDRLTNI